MEIYDKESRIYNGERIVSSINGVGKLAATWKRSRVDYILIPYTR